MFCYVQQRCLSLRWVCKKYFLYSHCLCEPSLKASCANKDRGMVNFRWLWVAWSMACAQPLSIFFTMYFHSHNFVVMKRRNAFWNLESTVEGLPHASSLQAATSHSGLLASLTSVNGIGGGVGGSGTKGLNSPIKPRRTRQFSLQF